VPQDWRGNGVAAQQLFSLPVLTRAGLNRVVLRSDVASLDHALNSLHANGAVVEHIYDY
jgi:hypothetical protein